MSPTFLVAFVIYKKSKIKIQKFANEQHFYPEQIISNEYDELDFIFLHNHRGHTCIYHPEWGITKFLSSLNEENLMRRIRFIKNNCSQSLRILMLFRQWNLYECLVSFENPR